MTLRLVDEVYVTDVTSSHRLLQKRSHYVRHQFPSSQHPLDGRYLHSSRRSNMGSGFSTSHRPYDGERAHPDITDEGSTMVLLAAHAHRASDSRHDLTHMRRSSVMRLFNFEDAQAGFAVVGLAKDEYPRRVGSPALQRTP